MKKILLVEDNNDLREMLEILFQSHDLEVRGCPDAKCFRIEMAEDLPNLVVMDVDLPDGNGLQLCKESKTSEISRNIPVLILTAQHSTRREAMDALADDFMNKPFDISVLISKVKFLMDKV